MKTRPLIAILAVLALAGGTAVHGTREVGQTRAAIDSITTQRRGLRATTANLEQRRQKAAAALAQSYRSAARPSGNVGAGKGTEGSVADTSATAATPNAGLVRPTAMTIIANDPERMAEYLQNYRASLDLTYGDLFKALGLSAEQIEKIKDLKISGLQQIMDLEAAVELQSLDRYSPACMKLRAEISKSVAAKEREVLGDRWNSYREFSRAGPVRYWLKELAGTAIYSGLPVTSAQVERATQVLAANSQRYQSGYVNRNTLDWPTARSQLQGVLSPVQVEILGRFIQRDSADAKIGVLKARLTAEFKSRMPPP